MSTSCTRCEGSGFLNLEQVPNEFIANIEDNPDYHQLIIEWIENNKDHNVQVCDCCGDGEYWYDVPGEHYNSQDPIGFNGPYEYNGGFCECN